MVKRTLVALCLLLSASTAWAQRDAIDLSTAVVHNSPADIASWSRTHALTALHMRPEGTAAEPGLSFESPARSAWPNYTPPGWDGPIQYTVWAGVRINGVWHVSGIIQMWRERVATGAPLLTFGPGCTVNNFACNWVYDGRWGAMAGYQPRAGEAMIFFLSAGNARGVTTVTSVRERTNVVMVNLPANDTGDWTFTSLNQQTDLLIDYGAQGLYTLTGGATVTRIHPFDPELIVTGDLDGTATDELIVDFGPSYGVWVRWNGATWSQLNPASPINMAVGDIDNNGRADAIINFPNAGVWAYMHGIGFVQLHNGNPSRLLTARLNGPSVGAAVIMEFAGAGIWIRYFNNTWQQLHVQNAQQLIAADVNGDQRDDLAIVFPGGGLWAYFGGAAWWQISATSPARIAGGNIDGNATRELVIDWPGYGLWLLRNGSQWSRLHTSTTRAIALADLDGNGQDEVVTDFGLAGGVWIWANDTTWMSITPNSPDAFVPGFLD